MKTITLPSGTYAVDDLLHGFEIMEKPSSNVAFTAINIFENKLYVQFKNGSGYMYLEVDVNTLKEAETCEIIGKFISSMVVKKFVGEKMEGPMLIAKCVERYHQFIIVDDPIYEITPENKNELFDKLLASRLPGKIIQIPKDSKTEYISPDQDEPEF